jgi:MoxR-vWA-beta-propeller ternary system domain bpX4
VSLSVFLRALFDHGRVQVAAPTEKITGQDEQEAEKTLREQDAALRLEGPGQLPELNMAVAMWAAKTCYGACQLIVFRQLDEQAIGELLPSTVPAAEPSSRHWSADLTLRFLPDLLRHASVASEQDPLLRHLRSLAYQWPLSSVGIEGIAPEHLDDLVASPSLLQLYVDRILARKDFRRLEHPAVREAARQAVGMHSKLWPDLTKYLEPTTPEPAPSTP